LSKDLKEMREQTMCMSEEGPYRERTEKYKCPGDAWRVSVLEAGHTEENCGRWGLEANMRSYHTVLKLIV
jgi:hypothetical protein